MNRIELNLNRRKLFSVIRLSVCCIKITMHLNEVHFFVFSFWDTIAKPDENVYWIYWFHWKTIAGRKKTVHSIQMKSIVLSVVKILLLLLLLFLRIHFSSLLGLEAGPAIHSPDLFVFFFRAFFVSVAL